MYRDPSEFRKRFKAYKDGKSVREIYGLPEYQDGKEATIQQGRKQLPIDKAEAATEPDYNEGWLLTTLKRGANNFIKTVKDQVRSARNIVNGRGDWFDWLNVGTDVVLGAGGKAVKGAAKEAKAAVKAIKPKKSSVKFNTKDPNKVGSYYTAHPEEVTPITNSEELNDVVNFMNTHIAPKYARQNKVHIGIDPADIKLGFADLSGTNLGGYVGPSGEVVINQDILNNSDVLRRVLGHEVAGHWFDLHYPLTPAQASIVLNGVRFNADFLNSRPWFDQFAEGNAERRLFNYLSSRDNGNIVGSELDTIINSMPRAQAKRYADMLGYNKGIEWQWPDILPFKQAATSVPTIGIPLYAGTLIDRLYKNGKLPRYGGGRITTGGAGVTSVYQPATTSEEAQPTIDVLERIANFLPYIGTIQDWDLVGNGNIGKIPSAVIGTVADIFLPGLRSSYKAAKAYEAMYKATPKIADKIKYYKASLKAYRNTSSNVGYLFAGLFEDILDDLGYQYPLFTTKDKYQDGKLPGYSNGKIRINPANRGKFNATKKRTGKTTEELTHSKNPLTRKRAIFALNARKWHHANGKLPGYLTGTLPEEQLQQPQVPQPNLGNNPTNATVNPNNTFTDDYTKQFDNLVVTGTDKRPMYLRYDAPNSTYDPNAIRNFTDLAPVVGDIGQGLDAYNAFKNQDYLLAGILGGMLLMPNALERLAKAAGPTVGFLSRGVLDAVTNLPGMVSAIKDGRYVYDFLSLLRNARRVKNLAYEGYSGARLFYKDNIGVDVDPTNIIMSNNSGRGGAEYHPIGDFITMDPRWAWFSNIAHPNTSARFIGGHEGTHAIEDALLSLLSSNPIGFMHKDLTSFNNEISPYYIPNSNHTVAGKYEDMFMSAFGPHGKSPEETFANYIGSLNGVHYAPWNLFNALSFLKANQLMELLFHNPMNFVNDYIKFLNYEKSRINSSGIKNHITK